MMFKEGNMHSSTDKKNQIVNAAENLFHRYGYSKTSMEDIAREAVLGKGTIYYYFESKEDIFFEVVKLHAIEFYSILSRELAKGKDFTEKFTSALRLPIKLVYENAPILMDALMSLPNSYMQKMYSFREANRQKMIDLLSEVINYGISNGEVTQAIPVEILVNIIFDWFLLGDSNLIVQNPTEFIKKAEADYEWIVQIMLYGIIKRG
jgi:AcrR family transcriptional regulator